MFQAADALRTDTVYVDPAAESTLSADEADRLRSRIRSAGAGPVRIAVLPERALDQRAGTPAPRCAR